MSGRVKEELPELLPQSGTKIEEAGRTEGAFFLMFQAVAACQVQQGGSDAASGPLLRNQESRVCSPGQFMSVLVPLLREAIMAILQ